MAEIIYCPCGRAIECARTDILESIHCPVCRRELTLDVTCDGQRRRAFLTIVAGPERVGEQILVPVGHELGVGSQEHNWLFLPDTTVAGHHCTLMLDAGGRLIVKGTGQASPGDGQAVAGTFQVELKPTQSMRIGAFKLQYTLGGLGDTAVRVIVAPTPKSGELFDRPMPALRAVTGAHPVWRALMSNRFWIARVAVGLTAALLGVYHGFQYGRREGVEPWMAIGAGFAVFWVLMECGRRIGLTRRAWNLGTIALLVAGALAEGAVGQHGVMVALLVLAAALVIALERPPSQIPLLFAYGLTVLSLVTMAASLLRPGGPVLGLVETGL